MSVRRVAAGRISPGEPAEIRAPLAFLCSSIAAEVLDLESATTRWSPSRGTRVAADGVPSSVLVHIAHVRELLRMIEDTHCVDEAAERRTFDNEREPNRNGET